MKAKTIIFFCLVLLYLLTMTGCDSDKKDDRNKFIGRYEVVEYSLITYTPRDDYVVRISKDIGTENMMRINNFYNFDIEVLAEVHGYDIIVFPQTQNVFVFEGSGTLVGTVITMNYTVHSVNDDSDFFDQLRAEMTLKE
ncbi:MAG: hypothetical protein EA394_05175 [Bacteroidia bacterium]|nr:MAG: hypothetical protein EA394_05175 [Bacteroidia bacterium]